MSILMENQMSSVNEDLKDVKLQLEILNAFIQRKFDSEFQIFVKQFSENRNRLKVSFNNQQPQVISKTGGGTKRLRKSTHIPRSFHRTDDLIVEETTSPQNNQEKPENASTYVETVNGSVSSVAPQKQKKKNNISNMSFEFETTVEYNPEEFNKDQLLSNNESDPLGDESKPGKTSIIYSPELRSELIEISNEEIKEENEHVENSMELELSEEIGDDKKPELDEDDEYLPEQSDDEEDDDDDDEDFCIMPLNNAERNNTRKRKGNSSGGTVVRCLVCNAGFKEKQRLDEHKKRHGHEGDAPEKKNKCPTCSKTFRFQSHLEDHQRIHSDEKPFVCPHCSKGFRQASSMRVHVRTHTGEKPFRCKVCGHRFRCSSNLRSHEKIHN